MNDSSLLQGKANFGTAPVYLTAISTILGAVMFLRFGYAVGNVGFLGTLGIILIGHLVTISTAMAIAEIATNQKVEGGGEYYIISRSFGIKIGGAIGIALYFSQAISVAFYVIAFAEAFGPVFEFILHKYGYILDGRIVSIPTLLILAVVMLTKGADLGVKFLYVVVALLALSLVLFFAGSTPFSEQINGIGDVINNKLADPDDFFTVFAIVFPAFTGMTAGVGLSGDLKEPKKSIPLGTMSATLTGMVVYVFIAYKLATSASAEELVGDQLIMQQIAVWGPIIPIGLAAACFSSALGSIMVAPRTLQAISKDEIIPNEAANRFFSKGKPPKNEPLNASVLTVAFAIIFIIIGDVNFVAKIISMFFMVTYGSICLISFLEHFAADPSYRPAFKSRWYISLLGALLCVYLMFKMNSAYALLSIIIMVLMFVGINRYKKDSKGLATIFQGAIFQVSRRLQVFLQKTLKGSGEGSWRPAVICISEHSFERYHAFDLLRWISDKYGFGTYIHQIIGYASKQNYLESQKALSRLITLAESSRGNVFLDTIISPSYTSSIAQAIQLPGISGKDNNMMLLEFMRNKPEELDHIIDNIPLVKAMNFDICILGGDNKGFGYKREIHVWITSADYENANLMILLAYITLGHREWKGGQIKIFALLPASELAKQKEKLLQLIRAGRLPISPSNIELIPLDLETDPKTAINDRSEYADLTIIGFLAEALKHRQAELLTGYIKLGNILFVNSSEEKEIK
jgi:amino acid transporter